MIISVSGRIGSGKDLTAKTIQALIDKPGCFDKLKEVDEKDVDYYVWDQPSFEIKKFADKLKDMVCILLNCTREQLEDREFKEKELGEEWWIYKVHDGSVFRVVTKDYYNSTDRHKIVLKLTPRKILQLLGTEAGRDILHPNIWVNSLMSEYKKKYLNTSTFSEFSNTRLYSKPNWVISDTRFPNEFEAVKSRGGLCIKVERESELYYKYSDIEVEQKLISMGYEYSDNDNFDEDAINEGFEWSEKLQRWSFDEDIIVEHFSETALDGHTFDYVIENNGTIKELVEKVKVILKKEKLI